MEGKNGPMQVIRGLAEEGKSVLLATHEMVYAKSFLPADRINPWACRRRASTAFC